MQFCVAKSKQPIPRSAIAYALHDGTIPVWVGPGAAVGELVYVGHGVTLPPCPPRCWFPASAPVPSGGGAREYVPITPGAETHTIWAATRLSHKPWMFGFQVKSWTVVIFPGRLAAKESLCSLISA